MSAPIIWIITPLILGIILWMISNERLVTWLGIGFALILALTAWIIPIETPLNIGNWSIKISTTMTILGRHLTLAPTDQPLLIFLYFSLCYWFLCSSLADPSSKHVSFGFLIIALLISALAVEPFLYAALLIEIAILVSIPLLKPTHIPTGRGLIRFLAFQTIAMPFILFSGWLLTGVTTGPEELSLIGQAAIFLGLGFVFLLAIFPFNTWIPLLVDEAHLTSSAFILWIFPIIGLLFGLYFLDTYSWIRDSNYLPIILLTSGLIMIVTGGLWAAFQKNLKRMLAYALIMETGYSLLALSIKGQIGIDLFFGLLIPRTLAIFLWSLALSIMLKETSSDQFSIVKGFGRKYPFSAAAIILSHLSFTGIPILAGFPIHQALWEQLGIVSFTSAIWYGLATIGLLMAGLRSMAVLVSPSSQRFIINESWPQRILLSFGVLMLIVAGIFPQWVRPLLSAFPTMFSHIAK